MRNSFIFYRSFAEAANTLTEKERLRLYDSIVKYALDDEPPQLSGAASGLFYLIKPQIDANNKRFENGRRGGRPKEPKDNQKETKPKPNHNQTITKAEPNDNDNVNVNVNVNDNENVNGKWIDERINPVYLERLNRMRSRRDAVNERRRHEQS